jgi:hypothetical protein
VRCRRPITLCQWQKRLDPSYDTYGSGTGTYSYVDRLSASDVGADVAAITTTGDIGKPLITVAGTMDALLPINLHARAYARAVAAAVPDQNQQGGDRQDHRPPYRLYEVQNATTSKPTRMSFPSWSWSNRTRSTLLTWWWNMSSMAPGFRRTSASRAAARSPHRLLNQGTAPISLLDRELLAVASRGMRRAGRFLGTAMALEGDLPITDRILAIRGAGTPGRLVHVVGKAPAAGQQPRILAPPSRLADPLRRDLLSRTQERDRSPLSVELSYSGAC